MVCIFIIIYSGYRVYDIYREYNKADSEYTEISKVYYTTNKNPIDFDGLSDINSDIVAWIVIDDTKINYPVVRGRDNSKYLNHTFNGQYNTSGSIFMDFRNNSDFTDLNTIIYGHHIKNGSMFGELDKFKDQIFYDSHSDFMLYTKDKIYKCSVFSAYVTNSTSEAYRLDFNGVNFLEYKNMLVEQSEIETYPSDVSENILTISTCDYTFNNARFVVHAYMSVVEN